MPGSGKAAQFTHRRDQSHIYVYVHREYPSRVARECGYLSVVGQALGDLIRILSCEGLEQVLIHSKTKMLGYANTRPMVSA